MIVGITGHRPDKLNNAYDVNHPLRKWLREQFKTKFVELKATTVISGMAIGADVDGALSAIELGIPVIAAVPFVGQEEKWSAFDKALYHKLLNEHVKQTVVVSVGGYHNEKFFTRNKWIVDNCEAIVAVHNGLIDFGGTFTTIKFASITGRSVHIINPNDGIDPVDIGATFGS